MMEAKVLIRGRSEIITMIEVLLKNEKQAYEKNAKMIMRVKRKTIKICTYETSQITCITQHKLNIGIVQITALDTALTTLHFKDRLIKYYWKYEHYATC